MGEDVMTRALVPVALFASVVLAGGVPAFADGGRIVFTGSIVESSCPMRDGQLDCPSTQRVNAAVRSLDMQTAQRSVTASLFNYALQRDPAQAWRLIEVTYP
jgi:type 1 fimbria pilin